MPLLAIQSRLSGGGPWDGPRNGPQFHILPGSTGILDDLIIIGVAAVLLVTFTYAWNRWGRF